MMPRGFLLLREKAGSAHREAGRVVLGDNLERFETVSVSLFGSD